MPLLVARGLTIAIAGRTLLRGVDLELDAGDAVCLYGASGVGKTSLLRVLAHLANPIEGSVSLDNSDARQWEPPSFRRHAVFVTQRPTMFPGTVLDGLKRPFRYKSAERHFPLEEAQRRCAALRLPNDVLERDAESLSEGEQQRVSLVRALLLRPRVLLIDEPTSALDEETRDLVEEQLRRFIAEGGALFAVSHDRAQAGRLGAAALDVDAFRPGEVDA